MIITATVLAVYLIDEVLQTWELTTVDLHTFPYSMYTLILFLYIVLTANHGHERTEGDHELTMGGSGRDLDFMTSTPMATTPSSWLMLNRSRESGPGVTRPG